jgi:hypothetical protein
VFEARDELATLPTKAQQQHSMASSPPAMTPTEKFNLIVRNLEEHYGDDLMMKILQERDLKLYWGTAPTGPPHCGTSLRSHVF